MSLLLLLSNTSGVVKQPVAVGWYDAKPIRRKKRYVVKINGSLVQFSSKALAIEALEALDALDKPIDTAQITPVNSVPIEVIRELAIERQADDVFQKHLDAMKYKALLALYEQWKDDQDVEDLLMMVL